MGPGLRRDDTECDARSRPPTAVVPDKRSEDQP